MADFSSKIKMAYALGVGAEHTRDDLNIIRSIRNFFAHTPRVVSLSEDYIQSEINKLYVVNDAPMLLLAGFNQKQRFAYAITMYSFSLKTHHFKSTGGLNFFAPLK